MTSEDYFLPAFVDSELATWLSDRYSRMEEGVVGEENIPNENHVGRQVLAELRTWYVTLARERAAIPLTVGQARLLADALHDVEITPLHAPRVQTLLNRTMTARQRSRTSATSPEDTVWDEAVQLVENLRQCGPAGDHALIEAFSRWRSRGGEKTIEAFVKAGLRIVDAPTPVAYTDRRGTGGARIVRRPQRSPR